MRITKVWMLTVKPDNVIALAFPFKLSMLIACIRLRTTVLGDCQKEMFREI